MNLKLILACLIALSVAFAFGRFSAPEKVRIETRTVEVEKKTEKVDSDRHRETTVTEVDKPDGTKETVTKTVEDTTKHVDAQETDIASKASNEVRETNQGGKISVALLGGVSFKDAMTVYGASVSRQTIGPLTIGAFGLRNGIAGVSLGLTF